MNVTRFKIQACCGKTAIIFKTDQPLTKVHLAKLVSLGFIEATHLTKGGIIYAENSDFILSGPIGSDRLQCLSKKSGSDEKFNDIEELLNQL